MKKTTRYTLLFALVLGLLASAINVQAANVVTVDPSSMGGTLAVDVWGFANEGTGTGGYGFSVGPASHSGSLKLTTAVSSDGPYFAGLLAGFNIPDLTNLKYDAYSAVATSGMPTLQLDVDYDSTDGITSWQGRLVFVPNGPFIPGTWYTYDALSDTDGVWFGTGGAGAVTCPISAPCVWSTVEAAFPNLVLYSSWSQGVSVGSGAIGFKKGSGDAAPFEGYVDNLVIDSTTYDFEPASDIYVDAAWAGATLGSDPDGAGPAHAFGADAFATIEEGAVAVPVNGTVHVASGTYILGSQIAFNKAGVTFEGAGSASTVIQVSGTGERFFITALGVSIQGFHIEKTDKTGVQNIIYIGSNNVTIQNNEISGQYVIGDGDVSRAMVFTGGLSGITITNNTIHDLRQPAYISGVTTGTISNNYVYRTKGWVLEEGNMTFTNNTWGAGADANVFDIAILSMVSPSYYTDVPAMSAANHDAFIEDQRTSPATLSIVYVDGSVSASGTGTMTSPVKTIAEGITRVVTGGTIHVMDGVYKEEPIINKALRLLGPNAGVNPNTGVRGTEAVIQPVTEGTDPNGTCTVVLYVSADDVTIDGMTIDGDNPDLTSGVLVNGVDVDACEGIAGWDGSANMVVENNIVKNTTYTGIDFDNYNVPGATAGNYIRYNLLHNIGNSTIGYGIGVLVYDNFYADITNNVFTAVRVGIQTGNYHLANPGTTGRISDNEIHSWRAGIFHNLFYSGASDYPLLNNDISVIDSTGTTRWNGILFTSFSVPVTIGNNIISATDVTQQTVGYMVWNDKATSGLTISGGNVSGTDYGVWVNNYQGYGPSNGGDTSITIDGLTISGASSAGIYVQDDSANTNFATVAVMIKNTKISGSAVAVKIDGSDASATGSLNQFAGNSDGVINTTSTSLDFRKNWWGASSGPGPVGPGAGVSVSTDVAYTPWCGDAACTLFAPNPLTDLSMVQSPSTSGPWSPVSGSLGSGYLLSLNGVSTDFVYLNVDSLTLTSALQDGYHPFTLDTASLPAGYYSYWDGKGVNSSAAPGTWQAEMWKIINGTEPIFYLKVAGTTYTLVDGLGHNMGGPDGYLRISGDYPLGTYSFDGVLTDTTGTPFGMTATLTTSRTTYTISGKVGVVGATITYTGGSTTSDASGAYTFTVTYNWSGTVTPTKTGYVFTPLDHTYTNVQANQENQSFGISTWPSWYGAAVIQSDQDVIALGSPYIGSEIASYGGFTSGNTTMYVPMLFKQMWGSYDSALYIQNTDPANAANISIKFYDPDGVLSCTKTDLIPSGSSHGYWLPDETCLPANWYGGVVVTSDRDIVAVGRPHIGNQVMTYSGFASGSLTMYVPMLFKQMWGTYDSAFYVQNTDPVNSADVTIKFYDPDGVLNCTKTDTIPRLSSHGYWLPYESCLPANWYGGVVVTSNRNIVAVGRPHLGSEITSYNGVANGNTSIYAPALFNQANGGSDDSALYIQNVHDTDTANVTIKFYDTSGSLSCTLTDTISHGSSKGYWLPYLTCLPVGWEGSVKVESDQPVAVIGRPHFGNSVTAYNGMGSGGTNVDVPMLFKQMWGNYDSTLYLENTDSVNPASVTTKFYDVDGNLSCVRTDTIDPLATLSYWLPSLTCSP